VVDSQYQRDGLGSPLSILAKRGEYPCTKSFPFKPIFQTQVRVKISRPVFSRSLIKKQLVDGVSFKYRNSPHP